MAIDTETVYIQDREDYRYQDQLKWSRFKTLSAIEAGMLFAVLHRDDFSPFEIRTFLAFAVLLILIVSLLLFQDRLDANMFRYRSQELQGSQIPALTETTFFRGFHAAIASTVVVNLFNVCLLVYHFVWWSSAAP